jgi:hypothetical protein
VLGVLFVFLERIESVLNGSDDSAISVRLTGRVGHGRGVADPLATPLGAEIPI